MNYKKEPDGGNGGGNSDSDDGPSGTGIEH